MILEQRDYPPERMMAQAEAYLEMFHGERAGKEGLATRLAEVEREIADTGVYRQTFEELLYGAQIAWRNSVRCIGRHYWKSLGLVDCREVTTAGEIFDSLVDYLARATNNGRIRPLLIAFAPPPPGQPGIRVWNDQLIRYAGYRQPDGTVLGDPAQVELTAVVQQMGWSGEGTPFDVLPLVIEVPGERPKLFELPPEVVLEVPLTHPDYPGFAELGLRWHAVPSISNMRLEVGGVSYTAAPFNGWYMGTEVGARNFGDETRYNLLPAVAEVIGLDTRRDRDLWRDRAIVELNLAVLHSYEKAGVKMVDHHTAARHFVKFEGREAECGRETLGDWEWLVPPISGSVTPVFHRRYENREVTPNFFVQPKPWQRRGPAAVGCPMH